MQPQAKKWASAKSFKQRIRDRDKVCRICGSDKILRCCHIVPRREKPSLMKRSDNVILLCALCDWEYGELLDTPRVKKLYRK